MAAGPEHPDSLNAGPTASRQQHPDRLNAGPTASRRQVLRGLGATAMLGLVSACSKSSTSTGKAALQSASVSVPPVSPAPSQTHDVTAFGAVGDGSTDDTAAIARALAALQPGQALAFPAGKTFAHSAVLSVQTPKVMLLGPGTLAATNEAASALKIDAAGVVVDALTLTCANTTRRWSTPDQHKLYLGAHDGIQVRGVIVKGSAAAGVFCLGATNFALEAVQVSDTRADGIHMTYGCANGTVVAPVVSRSGDDGVAVVSYLGDKVICKNIAISHPTVATTTGGRGLSVVGGENITYTDITVSDSDAAAVYIACEGTGSSPNYPVQNVKVTGGTIAGANTDATIDQGAVLVYSGRSGGAVANVTVSGLAVTRTRPTASRQVGVVTDNGGAVSGVTFSDLRLDAAPAPYQGNGPSGSFTLSGVTAAGKPVPAAG